MSSPVFKTKSGQLTPYALACGYIEQFEFKNVHVNLWHEGGPVYQVRQHDFNKSERIFWDSFTKLTDARKRFNQAKRMIKSS